MSDTHAQTAAYQAPFVREEMVGASPPPVTERGAIKWLRENLFSGWLNIALTVLGVLAIWWIAVHVFPWMFRGIWNADSLTECRAIRNERYGEGVGAACWAVLVERWNQLMFGFYPSSLYLRATAGVVVLLLGLAPILFASLPRRALWLTAASPFAAFWLIWGGTIWLPVLVAAGFGVAALVYAALARDGMPRTALTLVGALLGALLGIGASYLAWLFLTVILPYTGLYEFGMSNWFDNAAANLVVTAVATVLGLAVWAIIHVSVVVLAALIVVGGPIVALAVFNGVRAQTQGALALIAFLALIAWWFGAVMPGAQALQDILPISIRAVGSESLGGFLLAIVIGLSAIILSLPLGILLALGRQSNLFIVSKTSVVFIETIRGVPLIVWLFTASLLLNYFLPPGTEFDIVLRVIIMVTLFASAYIAEVVRGGLAALPKGQYEGADSLGLDYWQSMRLVILPQALKISIPGIVNTFIGLFKDTTLVLFIGLADPIGFSNLIRATTDWNGIYWELFIFIGLCFFVFCYAMSRYSMYLERKLAREHR